jgi:uncharacterized protein YcbK (DUF882 family)
MSTINNIYYMITMQELLKGTKFEDIPKEHQDNLLKLLAAVNIIREAWGKPMRITSGYRSMLDHLRIYREKGITDKSKIPMKSKHLFGAGVDIADPGLLLTKWLQDHPEMLEKAGLFCEAGNSNWVHFQCLPFGSYKPGKTRWFNP